jgi:hypothetical protein
VGHGPQKPVDFNQTENNKQREQDDTLGDGRRMQEDSQRRQRPSIVKRK